MHIRRSIKSLPPTLLLKNPSLPEIPQTPPPTQQEDIPEEVREWLDQGKFWGAPDGRSQNERWKDCQQENC